MEKSFTSFNKFIRTSLLIIFSIFLNSIAAKIYAQVGCSNETVYFLETFGAGTTPTSWPDVIPTALTYQATGSLAAEGIYRVINSTQQKPEWQYSPDHTGNTNGDMLVVNGQAETFYMHTINLAQGFFPPGDYTASVYLMNVDTLGVCAPNPLLTNLNFSVEYLSSDGTTWAPLNGSPYVAPPIQQTPPWAPTWVSLGDTFTLPPNLGFKVSSIRIVLTDDVVGGCGNDFAMDDVKFALCPEPGPLPVQFLGISASQIGGGVNVAWSTAQEINSSSFAVEKSQDGNFGWSSIASISASGNSSTVRNYSFLDPVPLNGANFYRIRQNDKDGNFSYSKTVSVIVHSDQTSVSVLENPFHSSLTVSFSGATNELVSARLIDITGKVVAAEKWSVSSGTSINAFSNISGLQPGLYILNVSSDGGGILFNNKVLKQ